MNYSLHIFDAVQKGSFPKKAVIYGNIDGFEPAVFPYMTDIALLPNWGKPLLYGPGSILVAHTDDEHVEIAHLERAVADYVRLAADLRA